MITLTPKVERIINSQNLKPTLILEIEGYSDLFSVGPVAKIIRIGDRGLKIDGTWEIGGIWDDYKGAFKLISTDGTTSTISQQLFQDKGGTSSVSSIQISLIDLHEKVTKLVSPNVELADILGRRAWVWIGFEGALFPDDYVILLAGIIDDVLSKGAEIVLNIAHPDQLKRQDIFVKYETALNGAINNSVTTITLDSTEGFLLPADTLKTYVRINDEIIEYTGISGNQLTGCVRGQLTTLAASHDDEDTVSSFYRLQGPALEMALKFLLSSPDTAFYAELSASQFSGNVITFSDDLIRKYGVTAGDSVTITGTVSNNGTRLITAVSSDTVTVDGSAFVTELSGTVSFSSRYNVLPDGLGLQPSQVDILEFERLQDLFFGQIPTYDFYLKDTVKGREFLDQEVLFPANFFSLPRNSKVSIGAVAPPLSVATLPRINADNITNPSNITIRRTIGKYFYNTTIYKYDYDSIDDVPLKGFVKVDEDSKARIDVKTRAITFVSKGLRSGTLLDIQSRRFLDRYKFAAEEIRISVFFGVGFKIDVGDIVYFGDESMPLLDSKQGKRGFKPRLCEVVDKKMNIFTGRVDLVLVDTAYSAEGRYGIFSPSSVLGSGSTVSSLAITNSYGVSAPDKERDKWEPYLGQGLLIRSPDWSSSFNSKLLGFADDTTMLISPIGSAPSAGWIVDVQHYDSGSDPEVNFVLKNVFCFSNPSVAVVSGSSQTVFTVSGGDIGDFLLGATVLVRNADWSVVSPEVTVTDIAGNTITVSDALGFTPSSANTVELIGFLDSGSPYKYL